MEHGDRECEPLWGYYYNDLPQAPDDIFCANTPSDLYVSILLWDTEFMSYTFITQTFAFLLPVIMPHKP